MTNPNDYPLEEIVKAAAEIIKTGDFMVLQKFSCEHCGQRLTISEPNKIYTEGTCDKCGKVTDIRKHGCNYVLLSDNPVMRDVVRRMNEEG